VSERTVAGGILVLVGALALVEARRLAVLRQEIVAGAVVGDDTFPSIVGLALLVLGGYLLLVLRWPTSTVRFPAGAARRRILGSAGIFVGYCLIVPYLGYTLSTLLGSTGLYRTMGAYRWWIAFLIGTATTGLLHLVFRLWLLQPLPTGWWGI
jgi:putative tricarboxylic transport membrane protein